MITKTSKTGIKMIEQFEGLRLEAYRDAVGIPTIGYGHIRGVYMGMRITQAQAEEFLKQDLEKSEKAVYKYDSIYHWNQNEFDALVSFAFNIGNIDQLTANGSRGRTVIAEKIPAYCKAGGKVLKGLQDRRAKEKALFCTPAGAAEKETPQPAKKKTIAQIAKEVIKGLWGNGADRKARLEAAGYDYTKVQNKVNKLLKGD